MNSHVLSPAASHYIDGQAAAIDALSPDEIVGRIEAMVDMQERWRGSSLNLNPAEGLISRRARALLDSDLATRLTEGIPGDKLYPHGRLNDHVDAIEATVIALARRLFGATHVEWRPVSNSMANMATFAALLEPGDRILAQDEDGGGNFSYHRSGVAGVLRLDPIPLPIVSDCFEIDLDAAERLVAMHRPKLIVIGGGKVLFPYPVEALRVLADRVGAILVYDAAHLGLHISAGDFQRPLAEGAHVVTLSTHKVMGGPVGGLILTNDADIARRVVRTCFPGLLQTRDLNKYAALAVSLSETLAHGAALSRAMVVNAQALGRTLIAHGFDVIGADRGISRTHQLFLRFNDGDEAGRFEHACHAANIFLSDCALPGDMALGRRSGARFATHEVTRLGMTPAEMEEVGSLIATAARDGDTMALRIAVAALRTRFPAIGYSFDAQSGPAR